MKKENISSSNEKLVIDGNAFYELDLDCITRHQKAQKNDRTKINSPDPQKKGQRK